MTTILFWDIDGTLLTTGKAGVPAWEQAVREVTGREFQLSSIRVPGLTDFQIAVKTFELLGVDVPDQTLRRMVRRYEDLLPAYLPLRKGSVLPNVREILDELRDRSDVRSYLLTGNTRGGARAKLTHYDLLKYFAGPAARGPAYADAAPGPASADAWRDSAGPDGAFAEDTQARSTIAARALELARRAAPIDEERLFVIGDTPHDIDCANAIGARTIAVATGGYSIAELETHAPWRVFDQLPPPAEFLALIGTADVHSPGPVPVQGARSR